MEYSSCGDLNPGRSGTTLSGMSVKASPPSSFMCPITHEMMVDPVFTADGHTFERKAIAKWFERHCTRPATNKQLEHTVLTSNFALKKAIAPRPNILALHTLCFNGLTHNNNTVKSVCFCRLCLKLHICTPSFSCFGSCLALMMPPNRVLTACVHKSKTK